MIKIKTQRQLPPSSRKLPFQFFFVLKNKKLSWRPRLPCLLPVARCPLVCGQLPDNYFELKSQRLIFALPLTAVALSKAIIYNGLDDFLNQFVKIRVIRVMEFVACDLFEICPDSYRDEIYLRFVICHL